MGLDITAYSKVDFSSRVDDEDRELDGVYLYPEKAFEIQNEGLEEGTYQFSGEEYKFKAGSYGGYNFWREQLAAMLGTTSIEISKNKETYKNTPFFELIYFSDSYGFIGPKTSAKLYQDFLNHDEQAEKFSKEIGEDLPYWSFKAKYNQFKEAFRIASDGGVVFFH